MPQGTDLLQDRPGLRQPQQVALKIVGCLVTFGPFDPRHGQRGFQIGLYIMLDDQQIVGAVQTGKLVRADCVDAFGRK